MGADKGSNLTPDEVDHNCLYLCCAIQSHYSRFQENGAVAMNHMIQERAGFTKAEAFKVVADAIGAGLIVQEKRKQKRLSIVEEKFRPFRDRMIARITKVQSEVVTFNWHLHRPRQMTPSEMSELAEHVKSGVLKDAKRPLPERVAKDIFAQFDRLSSSSSGAVRNPFPAEKASFTEHMSEGLRKFCKAMGPKDFLLIVTKTGVTIRPAMKILEHEENILICDP